MNYTIIGDTDCPLVQIRLQRDETVRIERGCMAYMSDVELTGKPIPEKTLRFIFELKTGALIEAAMMIGAQLAGASEEQIAAAEKAAGDIGMAFQIQDDVLDVIGNEALLGKPIHSDEKNEKTTWVTVYGLEQARKDVSEYSQEAMDILSGMQEVTEPKASFLYHFVEYLIHRNK